MPFDVNVSYYSFRIKISFYFYVSLEYDKLDSSVLSVSFIFPLPFLETSDNWSIQSREYS